MKFILVLLLSCVFSLVCLAQNTSADPKKVVDNMPRFPGCEDIDIKQDRDQCAQQKLLEYVYKNIKYPEKARLNNIEGLVVVSFLVTVNGSIENVKILREIGGGCGDEVMRVVQTMNQMPYKWIPGDINGEAIEVVFTLPAKFKLEGKRKAKNKKKKKGRRKG